jgi:YD repeat-containing protein
MHASMHVLLASVTSIAVALTACSERGQSSSSAATHTDEGPNDPSIQVASLQKLSSSVTAAGVPTRYDAYFDGQQLKVIVESRQGAAAAEHGEYQYLGARLLEYAGGALASTTETAGDIELKFDTQGRLLSARDREDPSRTIEQAQIDGLRARAELLRSHALAQRSVSAHQQAGEERG